MSLCGGNGYIIVTLLDGDDNDVSGRRDGSSEKNGGGSV